jgi:hypothetical protein
MPRLQAQKQSFIHFLSREHHANTTTIFYALGIDRVGVIICGTWRYGADYAPSA